MRVGRDLQRSQKVRVAHVGSSATNISGNNYGSEGWEFESLRLRQLNLNDLRRFLPAFSRSSTVWKLANFENPLFMRVGGPIKEGDLENVVPQYSV